MRRLAYEEAARLFRLALRVGGSELDGERRCRVLISSASALHLCADFGGRLEACLDAAALARGLGRADLLAEAALAIEVVGLPGFDIATRRLCEEALDALGPMPTALRARSLPGSSRRSSSFAISRRLPRSARKH
jgi:hypothetical protein